MSGKLASGCVSVCTSMRRPGGDVSVCRGNAVCVAADIVVSFFNLLEVLKN